MKVENLEEDMKSMSSKDRIGEKASKSSLHVVDTSRNLEKDTNQNIKDNEKINPNMQPVQKGVQLVGDFFGRMATLIVMVVTTINTTIVCVNDLTNGNYWSGGLHAFLLVFIHMPLIIVMIFLMVKAKVTAAYRKIRPQNSKGAIIVTEIHDINEQPIKPIEKTQQYNHRTSINQMKDGGHVLMTLDRGQMNKAFG